jgi:hypothetical protein
VGFNVTDELLISSFAFVRYWRKSGEYNETVHHLFIDFKKTCVHVCCGRYIATTAVYRVIA